jgi:hypothetical protein
MNDGYRFSQRSVARRISKIIHPHVKFVFESQCQALRRYFREEGGFDRYQLVKMY